MSQAGADPEPVAVCCSLPMDLGDSHTAVLSQQWDPPLPTGLAWGPSPAWFLCPSLAMPLLLLLPWGDTFIIPGAPCGDCHPPLAASRTCHLPAHLAGASQPFPTAEPLQPLPLCQGPALGPCWNSGALATLPVPGIPVPEPGRDFPIAKQLLRGDGSTGWALGVLRPHLDLPLRQPG